MSLGGAQSANYTLAEAVLAADITAAELTISSLAANNKVYDGTTDATLDLEGAVLVGVFEGDNVSLAGGTAVFADPGVGEGITVTVTGLELAGPSAGNYVLSETTASLAADITAKTLSVTGISVEDNDRRHFDDAGEGRTTEGQASRRSIGPGWVGCGQARAS